MRRRVTVVVCSVCVSFKSHLTSGAYVCPENTVTYIHVLSWQRRSNICGVFSETALLQNSSTPTTERPYVQLAIFLWKAHIHIIVFTTWLALKVLHFSAFIVCVCLSVCLSVCLLSHISPLERLFVLKILSHT